MDLDFSVIGAQKSGTATLHRALRAHPDVSMPANETTVFEDFDYSPETVDDLEAELARFPDDHLKGIKRPQYLAEPECAPRLAKHAPDADLVAILRDPVDRAVSAYFHYMRYGHIPVDDVDTGMRRLLDGDVDEAAHPRAGEVLEFGRYGAHLARLLDHFPRDQVLVLVFEDFLDDPQAGFEALADHLGIRPEDLSIPDRRNPGVYSLPRIRFRRLFEPVIHTRDPETDRIFHRFGVASRALARAVDLADQTFLEPILGGDRPALDPSLERELIQHYHPTRKRLRDELSLDLSTWTTQEPRV